MFYFFFPFIILAFLFMLFFLFFFSLSIYFYFLDMKIIYIWELFFFNNVCWDISFMFDSLSLIFCSFVLIISCSVFFFSNIYLSGDNYNYRFITLMLLFILSMIMVIFSFNLLFIIIGWDGLGLVSYLLIIYYGNMKCLSGGLLTYMTNRLGDFALIISICFSFYFCTWDYMYIYIYEDYGFFMMYFFVIMASMTKSAQLPFSAWLPAAMAAPTPVSSLVHSSTLVTAGIYLLIRFNMFIFNYNLNYYLLFFSLITMFMAGLIALFEFDVKKLVALSTLSQMGLMMFCISIGLFNMAFFHLLMHALFKALMFLCVGSLMYCGFGNQDMRFFGSLWSFNPFISFCLLLSVFSLSGFFFLSGFYSKDLIIEMFMMMDFNLFIFSLFFFSMFFTVIYSLRFLFYLYISFCNYNSCFLKYMNLSFIISLFLLSFFGIFFGGLMIWFIFPSPVYIILSIDMKNLIFFVIILSFIFYYWFFMNNFFINFFGNLVFWFMGGMWFFIYMSTQYFMKMPFYLSSFFYKLLDKGWSEFYGGMGMYNSLLFFSSKSYNLKINNMFFFYFSFFIWLMLIFLLIFLF
uniref:NADH dehydrogenase subunit 5 n=1 Tax=Pentapycnon charcoti TaxID=373304 RepID=UPI00226CA1A2|nr:NADH dehydrogenase subunit 5 [Pentapycnon charcoti]UZA61216.1 NADH dehydrogenase subunit 5 [Pentapycnon charcoti]